MVTPPRGNASAEFAGWSLLIGYIVSIDRGGIAMQTGAADLERRVKFMDAHGTRLSSLWREETASSSASITIVFCTSSAPRRGKLMRSNVKGGLK